ncbi:MAG: response regulator [Planctomycetes bacterium]|nr:response regulator [Planctomycetota bacterium]
MKSLIVEDDFTARKLMQVYLSDLGESFIAVNGKEAVEVVTDAIEKNEPFDLICMDIMMPEMNGIEAVKIIRQIEKENGIEGLNGVKIIMTTAKGQSEDIFGAFNTGCGAYILKPVRKPALMKEIERLGLFQDQS